MPKVLIIEDDPLIHRLYKKTFELENYEVELADNGLAGLEIIPNFQPDVILLDIMMPTMNGVEFLSKLKADPATAKTPVVVLTNVSDTNVAHMALSKGAALCLIKSQTDPDDVVAAVKGVLASRSQSGEGAAADDQPDD